jgi:nucleoside-diphosphate-sugar epimerase
MEVAIVRPPLVYGPGVRANFLKLMEAVHKRTPLPFGLVRNRRSLIFVDNLADALAACLTHPAAAGRTFLISDGDDISTPDLIRELAEAMHVHVTLLPLPVGLLRVAGRLAGKEAEISRLIGSLSVDSATIRGQLAWHPPHSLREGLAATAADYWKTHAR